MTLWSSAAFAHTQPIPIERWGPFQPGSVTCMRLMSRAAHLCLDRVLDVQQRCTDAEARGETCDTTALADAIDEATSDMRAALNSGCEIGQLTEVGYIGFLDAEGDLFNACVVQARGAVEATYVPAGDGPAPEPTVACLGATAAYSRKVVDFILELATPVMERVATRLLTSEERMTSVQRMYAEIGTARTRWIEGLLAACPDFAAIYGRTPENFLRTIQQRAECVLSKTYVNTSVSCIAQACPNGIREATEDCDDGNLNNNDGCTNGCRFPAP